MLRPEALTPEQAALARALLAGPRGGGAEATPEAVGRMLNRGPFNAWMRSPALGVRLQEVGAYVRYGTSLAPRLSEFAILITARHWRSQFEWYAHCPIAVKAGLDPRIAAQLAAKRRPRGMNADEAAVYDFCTELHRKHRVGDAAFRRALARFGERGVMDLIGVCGYYAAVSMTLNVAEVPLPAGEKNPLK